MAKKIFKIIPILIIIGAIIILVIPRKSPVERAIDSAINAANAHDYARFGQYVDVERIIKEYADFSGERRIDIRSFEEAEYISERESEIRYFIENAQIPDPDRFRNIISTYIKGQDARAEIAFQLKKYSIVCTTSVYLHSSSDSKWKITGFDLRRIWKNIRGALSEQRQLHKGARIEHQPAGGLPEAAGLSPEGMIRDIIFDRVN